MNGLLQQQTPPQQAQAQPQAQARQPASNGQQVYTKIVEMALSFVYSEQGRQMVKEGLEMGNAGVEQNIGNVVAKLVTRVIISAKTAGKTLPAKMLFQIGMEITAAVAEMAEALGLTDDVRGIAKPAFFAALTITGREMPEDLMSQQERQEFRAIIEQVRQLDGQQPQQTQQMEQPQ